MSYTPTDWIDKSTNVDAEHLKKIEDELVALDESAEVNTPTLALQGLCASNEILYDDMGQPSVMVKIPKMTFAQLGMGDSADVHPAFIVNDQEVDAIWISKYQNVVVNSRAYSLPGQLPQVSTSFTNALTYCTNKGSGWHLMTRAEWGAIQRWCEANGFIPNGNNNAGKDGNESVYKAIPVRRSDAGAIQIVGTGTGPLSWSHNGEPDGIYDLKGNVLEWQGGIRMVYGEIQILANNNAADSSNSQEASSSGWKAIRASDGSLITPDGSGTTSGTVKLDYVSSAFTYSTEVTNMSTDEINCNFRSIARTSDISDEAWFILQYLGLAPYSSSDLCATGGNNRSYVRNGYEERLFSAGGSYNSAGYGLASVYGSARANTGTNFGFRSAYVEL